MLRELSEQLRGEHIVRTITNVGQIGAPAQVRRDSIQRDKESRKQQYGYRCHRTQKCGSLFKDLKKNYYLVFKLRRS